MNWIAVIARPAWAELLAPSLLVLLVSFLVFSFKPFAAVFVLASFVRHLYFPVGVLFLV